MANVTVTAYDSNGVAVASDTSDASGLYTLDLSGTAQTSFRLEFTTLPAGYQSSVGGADNNTSVVFASQGAYVDFGVFKPAEYYGNPRLALTRFVGQKFRGEVPLPVDPDTYVNTVISAAYRADSVTGDYPSGNDFHENVPWATYAQTGAVSGLAYQPTSRTLFTSAFFKANALYGPQGAGGIYSINLDTGAVSNFLDIDSYFGAGYTGSDIACDANGGSFDPLCFHEVGQQSLGDLDISSDFQTLYSVAIRTDELLAIPVGNPPTAPPTPNGITKYAIPQPAECTGTGIADYVPLGLGVKGATVYVGTVCTAQSTQNLAQLRGYIYAFNGGAFTQVLSFPLNYPRNTWNDPYPWTPWQPFSETDPPQPANAQQPWIADIVFDGEDMVFSVADRGGHQVQSGDQSPGGDILRACWTGSAWSLESNGVCDGATTFGNYGYNNQDGPGGGLYYWDQNGREGNTTLGALAQVPGYNNVVTMGADVRETDGMMGPLYINHDTGASDIWSPVFMIGFSNDIWGKGNGMGDLEILYDPAPIELGNRVWNDADGNGLQDPGEAPIAGVTVQLWADTDNNSSADTLVGTAVTAADGTYYFVSGTAADPNPGDNRGVVFYNSGGIRSNTAYEVRVATNQAPLSGTVLTTPNAPQPANGNASATNNHPITDVADSDASISGANAVIAYTTGGAGNNNHGLDFGFSPPLDYGDLPDTGAGTGAGNYQTLLSDNGPRHVIVSTLRLGLLEDAEGDGQQSAAADGDDINPSPTADDEDAVLAASLSGLRRGENATVPVSVLNNTGGDATLWGWIDFNANGVLDPGEAQTATVVTNATQQTVNLVFAVPLNATGSTFARFRLGTVASEVTKATGLASNGEVEDYAATTVPLDYGDAPDTGNNPSTGTGNYQTLLSDNGPRHVIVAGLNLGAVAPDPDPGTLQNPPATADDTSNTGAADDEDSILTLPTIASTATNLLLTVRATNTTNTAATLVGFIDFNRNGVFTDAGESATATAPAGSGTADYSLSFTGFAPPVVGDSYIRVRIAFDAAQVSAPTGPAQSGEVEDFKVTIETPTAVTLYDLRAQALSAGEWLTAWLQSWLQR